MTTAELTPNSFRNQPDDRGHFGQFGGRYVAETLMPLILDLEERYEFAKTDPTFWAEMDDLWKHYVGRPSPLYYAERLTQHLGGAKIYMKRDELNHTGAHKINNTIGQAMLAKRMGKTRVIAETGAAGMKDLGKVMPAAMKAMGGVADGKLISEAVKRLLA